MAEDVTVGVLLRRHGDRDTPFGSMTGFLARVLAAGRELGVQVYGFGAEDLHRRRPRVTSRAWDDGRQRWVEARRPLPDLVWDRLKGARGEQAVHQLRALGVPLLNTAVLNKWEAIQLLSRDPWLRTLMPHTRLLGRPGDVVEMLQRHGRAYLKPVVGSMGRGILRVLRAGNHLLGQSVPPGNGAVRSRLLAETDLADWLAHCTGGRQYLVQQGLHLEVFSGRTTDIRVLMQKDGDGRWQLTGMGARVGAPGRFTSNLHTGGQGIPVPRLLQALLPGDLPRQGAVSAEITAICLHVCYLLEASLGPLGELGIDLGLEPDGRLWYIEHNYYPGRTIFRHLGQPEIWALAHRRPLEYARWAVAQRRRGLPLLLPAAAAPEAPAAAPALEAEAGAVLLRPGPDTQAAPPAGARAPMPRRIFRLAY